MNTHGLFAPLADEDVVELILRTKDSGKSNNGLGCAVCHTTILKVDGFSHFSQQFTLASEKKIYTTGHK